MVLDYSERTPGGKNRPRKQPIGIFTLILVGAVAISFALGLLTGMFIFKPGRKAPRDMVSVAQDSGKSPTSPSSTQPKNPEAAALKGAEPPLTFYETLPKGGKAVLGSGLNPQKADAPQVLKPPAAVTPPAQPQAAQKPITPPAAAKPEERKEQHQTPAEQAKKTAVSPGQSKPPAASTGRYCVQVVSSQDRKEAEAIKGRLAEKGLAAYVVDSSIKDKGTWYRVRIGRHLTQQAAAELAGKVGKGALVISE